jgi:hypothetical protein
MRALRLSPAGNLRFCRDDLQKGGVDPKIPLRRHKRPNKRLSEKQKVARTTFYGEWQRAKHDEAAVWEHFVRDYKLPNGQTLNLKEAEKWRNWASKDRSNRSRV